MKKIGGYFELELPRRFNGCLHEKGIFVNSGRNALEIILRSIIHKARHIWVPYYTCDAVLQPIKKLGMDYSHYKIGQDFEIEEMPKLNNGDYIIINNYFGIKDGYINSMADELGEKLIIDNSQAWFSKDIRNIKTFYSPRKFFGIPDGGVALGYEVNSPVLDKDCSFERCSHLLKRYDLDATGGYTDFKKNSQALGKEIVKGMSDLTKAMLFSIDWKYAKKQRIANYQQLSESLDQSNLLKLPDSSSFECAMVYPYLVKDNKLRDYLISNGIYVASYWPNVLEWSIENNTERQFVECLLPLPIDQRYDANDMRRIIDVIKEY